MTPTASAQVPYIGSTISLLSKAGIRYEGFLHSIDQAEASVTLDHVRVFGTEDRQCERRVPQSQETFEYIIFRASDITELRVIDTPLSRPVPDPAIIRVQTKSSSAGTPTTADAAAAAAEKAGGAQGGNRRRQGRGQSSTGRGRQRYPQNQYQYQQQPHQGQHQHLQQPLLMHSQPPPQAMMQQHQLGPLSSPPRSQQQQQQQLRYRNDWYGGYRGSGYYGQYSRPPLYSTEFSAGGFVPPAGVVNGGVGSGGNGGGGGGGGRPVMQFRRFHGSVSGNGNGSGAQRLASSALSGGGGGGGGGGGRGRQSRRPQRQSDGMIQSASASAGGGGGGGPPTRYFSDDYDFETANAEMAKLLTLVSGSAPAAASVAAAGEVERGRPSAAAVEADPAKGAKENATVAMGTPGSGAASGARPHSGYDKDRSFYDDISRVDTENRTEAGGDSARPGGGRKEAAKQNALNRETFGLTGRRAVGGRLHGNNYHHRGAQQRLSPV